MRILVHDYAGHAFAVQLSRRLATRGHDVLHVYCGSTHTPRGCLQIRSGDSERFNVQALNLGGVIPKSGYWRRFRMESAYGGLVVNACRDFQPEVVLSANTPSLPQKRLAQHCRQNNIRHVFWVQDIYGVAAYKLLKKKLPILGHVVGQYFMSLDRASARWSDAVVVISEDFKPIITSWGVRPERIHVVHNWSVLEELPLRSRDNDWSREQHLTEGPRFLYSGTLAMKHNPTLLLELARMLDRRDDAQMIVVSEGAAVEWLQREAGASGISSLRCLPFQPFERMADVLGSADVQVAVLEPEAGVFSVPSKVLSYMCAGRAILGDMPGHNLAARLVVENNAGRVVEPGDLEAFRLAAEAFLNSPQLREECGAAARRYAETHFDIEQITDRFENILGA